MDTVCKNVQRPLCDVGAQVLWEEPPRAVSITCYIHVTHTHARAPLQYRVNMIIGVFNSLPVGTFVIVFCRLFFFQNQLFLKNSSGIPLECRTVWILIRPDVLVWVQTVCKSN